jgi:sugar lactone lactonase YvrE
MMMLFNPRPCGLGEGPLWHPLREDLFWFDITAHQLLSATQVWQFDEYVSAAGWISHDQLLIASESQLFSFDLITKTQTKICDLEARNPVTRSNDGRADPQGGFWIGTMGKNAEANAGAIYRYHRGTLKKLVTGLTIPNAICFAPDGKNAYYTDTPTQQILTVDLDVDGWPISKPRLAVDLTQTGKNPDGAVVDAAGNIWNAQWGAARLACYSPQGQLLETIALPAAHATCPAFAGATSRLFCTSATQGRRADELTPADGQTFETQVSATGQLEHQIIL